MPESVADSPLSPYHQAAGARMIPFAGWNLPVHFSGLLEEHRATRQAPPGGRPVRHFPHGPDPRPGTGHPRLFGRPSRERSGQTQGR
ncbi:MAG: hypothetical protein EBZ83_01030 [Verrucomicrobia bacterium]|nr:hypothetical protein [Verrucomicrobiota bacterium]